MSDRIEKDVFIAAPVERVWRALTDHEQFGAWFGVKLDGPFVVGESTYGAMTEPSFEGWPWESRTEVMEAPRLFAFTWAHTVERDEDPHTAPRTRVEFRLAPEGEGTRLTIVESGFDAVPEERRAEVMRNNARGWEIQSARVKDHAER